MDSREIQPDKKINPENETEEKYLDQFAAAIMQIAKGIYRQEMKDETAGLRSLRPQTREFISRPKGAHS